MRGARGTGIVELLVGLALGLFVVAGGLMLLAGFTEENRRLLLETRLVQDLRAASDAVTRDLRRAGYWDAAHTGVWHAGGPDVPPQNPYSRLADDICADTSALTQATTAAASHAICYAIQAGGDSNSTVDDNEQFGFDLDGGVIYVVINGAARQPLTDAKTIFISDLVITPSSQVLDASSFCRSGCTGSTCPQVVVREYEVLIKGHVPGDSNVSRSAQQCAPTQHHFGGSCPA